MAKKKAGGSNEYAALIQAFNRLPQALKSAVSSGMREGRREDRVADQKGKGVGTPQQRRQEKAQQEMGAKMQNALGAIVSAAGSGISAGIQPQTTAQQRAASITQQAGGALAGVGAATLIPGPAGFIAGGAIQEAASAALGAQFHKTTNVQQGVQQGMAPVEELMARGVEFSQDDLKRIAGFHYRREERRYEARSKITDVVSDVGRERGHYSMEDVIEDVKKELKKFGHTLHDLGQEIGSAFKGVFG